MDKQPVIHSPDCTDPCPECQLTGCIPYEGGDKNCESDCWSESDFEDYDWESFHLP